MSAKKDVRKWKARARVDVGARHGYTIHKGFDNNGWLPQYAQYTGVIQDLQLLGCINRGHRCSDRD